MSSFSRMRQPTASLALGWVLVCLLANPTDARAEGQAVEYTQLTVLLRQLDTLDQLIRLREPRPIDTGSRYHFDYVRLSADLQRMRTGIGDYLAPQRAQPRDPVELSADYRRERTMAVPEGTQ